VLASSVISEGHIISNRSSITVLLRKLMALLPGLFRSVSSVICHDRETSREGLQPLISDIRKFRDDMLQCHEQVLKLRLELRLFSYLPKNFDLVCELFGTTLMGLATANRMLSALGDSEGPSLESDNLLYVAELHILEADIRSFNGWVNFHLYQKMSIADSITKTTTIWKTAPGEIIERWRFNRWCRAMQRQICNCVPSSSTGEAVLC
jgi:hypothetical protein